MVSQIDESVKNGSVIRTQRSLQAASLRLKKNQRSASTTTKLLWLDAGEYYVRISTAKKGEEAYCTLVFFLRTAGPSWTAITTTTGICGAFFFSKQTMVRK